MRKGYLDNFKAYFLVTGVFLATCLLGLIPEWVYPGDPITVEIYDKKILLINICWSFKAWLPPLLILGMFRGKKLRTDSADYILLGLYFFTCMVDGIDAFANPYRDTFWDWVVIIPIWAITTLIKIFNYKKTG